jgi:hypothetical protein
MRIHLIPCALTLTLTLTLALPAVAQEDYASWPLLKNPFESTGGGGIMIGGYDPVVVDRTCVTDFTATTPSGEVYHNTIEFAAVPVQGGVLCTDGRWRARDGSASGTTPFRVFIKDGVKRRSP